MVLGPRRVRVSHGAHPTYPHHGAALVAKEVVYRVKGGAEEFRDQVQFKRVEIPDLWSKVQQYKGTFAVSDKL